MACSSIASDDQECRNDKEKDVNDLLNSKQPMDRTSEHVEPMILVPVLSHTDNQLCTRPNVPQHALLWENVLEDSLPKSTTIPKNKKRRRRRRWPFIPLIKPSQKCLSSSSLSDWCVLGRKELLQSFHAACGCRNRKKNPTQNLATSSDLCQECQDVESWALPYLSRRMIRLQTLETSEPPGWIVQIRGANALHVVRINDQPIETLTQPPPAPPALVEETHLEVCNEKELAQKPTQHEKEQQEEEAVEQEEEWLGNARLTLGSKLSFVNSTSNDGDKRSNSAALPPMVFQLMTWRDYVRGARTSDLKQNKTIDKELQAQPQAQEQLQTQAQAQAQTQAKAQAQAQPPNQINHHNMSVSNKQRNFKNTQSNKANACQDTLEKNFVGKKVSSRSPLASTTHPVEEPQQLLPLKERQEKNGHEFASGMVDPSTHLLTSKNNSTKSQECLHDEFQTTDTNTAGTPNKTTRQSSSPEKSHEQMGANANSSPSTCGGASPSPLLSSSLLASPPPCPTKRRETTAQETNTNFSGDQANGPVEIQQVQVQVQLQENAKAHPSAQENVPNAQEAEENLQRSISRIPETARHLEKGGKPSNSTVDAAAVQNMSAGVGADVNADTDATTHQSVQDRPLTALPPESFVKKQPTQPHLKHHPPQRGQAASINATKPQHCTPTPLNKEKDKTQDHKVKQESPDPEKHEVVVDLNMTTAAPLKHETIANSPHEEAKVQPFAQPQTQRDKGDQQGTLEQADTCSYTASATKKGLEPQIFNEPQKQGDTVVQMEDEEEPTETQEHAVNALLLLSHGDVDADMDVQKDDAGCEKEVKRTATGNNEMVVIQDDDDNEIKDTTLPIPPRSEFVILVVPLGRSLPKFRVNILQSALSSKDNVTVVPFAKCNKKKGDLPTHVIVDEHATPASVAEALGYGSVEEWSLVLQQNKIVTVKPEWAVQRGRKLRPPLLHQLWTGLRPLLQRASSTASSSSLSSSKGEDSSNGGGKRVKRTASELTEGQWMTRKRSIDAFAPIASVKASEVQGNNVISRMLDRKRKWQSKVNTHGREIVSSGSSSNEKSRTSLISGDANEEEGLNRSWTTRKTEEWIDSPPPPTTPPKRSPMLRNEGMSAMFQKLAKLHKRCPLDKMDEWRSYSYAVISSRLKHLPFEVVDDEVVLQRLNAVKGFGRSIMGKVVEYLQSGTCERIESFEKDPTRIGVKNMTGIWGVGPVKALELVRMNYTTIAKVRKGISQGRLSLSRNACIGVQCYEDLQEKMNRHEVCQIGSIVMRTLHTKFPGADMKVMGSYRRGAQTTGDVDFLIVHKDYYDCTPRGALSWLVETLMSKGCISHHLTPVDSGSSPASSKAAIVGYGSQDGSIYSEYQDVVTSGTDGLYESIKSFQTYMGVFLSPVHNGKHRRVDIKFYPYQQRAFASLYFTGSAFFNRAIRLWATRQRGVSLSDHGFRYIDKAVHTTQRTCANNKRNMGASIPFEAEKEEDIFDFLGLEYKYPCEREGFDAVVEKGALSPVLDFFDETDK